MSSKLIRNKFLESLIALVSNKGMKIFDRVNQLRELVKASSSLREISDASGVTYAWVVKFANGIIQNPTVENIDKLESYFFADDQDAA